MEQARLLSEMREMDWLAPITRAALRYAGAEARELRNSHIYPEHLLLGLLALQGEPLGLLFQANHLSAAQVRKRVQERFKPELATALPADQEIPLAEEAEDCLQRAVMALIAEVPPSGVSRQVTPELLALSLFANPRVQHVLAPAATLAVLVHNRLIEQIGTARFRRMERRFLFALSPEQEERIALQYVNVGQQKRVLKSVEPPLYHLTSLETLPSEVRHMLALLRGEDRGPDPARGLLLFESPGTRIKQFVRGLAGEAGTPLTIIFCSVLAEIWREYGAGKQSRAILRELSLALRLRPANLIYLEDLDALSGLDAPRAQSEQAQLVSERHSFWPLFLAELDKLLARPACVVLAATSQPAALEPALLAPERLGQSLVIAVPETLEIKAPPVRAGRKARPVLPANLAPRQRCHSCQQPVQEEWRHCVYCGVILARACPTCGSALPDIEGARFCFHCGHALA